MNNVTRRCLIKSGATLLGSVYLRAQTADDGARTPMPPREGVAADLVVWDSTPAGIIAAIAAARAGLKAIIVTEDRHVGGMQTSGLGFTNVGQRATVGGYTAELHERIAAYYRATYGESSLQFKNCSGGYRFEPHVAEKIYTEWLKEAGVECRLQRHLAAVEKSGNRILALRTQSDERFTGKIFIDASYEGDLLKKARCSYHLGRESRSQYGEKLAGATYPKEREGLGDYKLQPFDYRMCLTDQVINQVPFTEPEKYDPAQFDYEIHKLTEKPPGKLVDVLPLNWMPNRKTDSRTAQWPGHSWDYIEADAPRRLAIERAHQHRCASYLWFVMTDSRVPRVVRDEAARFGLAKDEFVDNRNFPYHIYVREGRRLVGDYVMTESDCLENRFKQDGVGLCSWYLDVHPVEVIRTNDGFHRDGSFNVPVKAFEIPYRALLPKVSEAENLLVPVGLSASHVAFSSIRVEPTWMILGQAAGTATAMSLEAGVSLHRLPTDRLRSRLQAQGQVIDARPFPKKWPDSEPWQLR